MKALSLWQPWASLWLSPAKIHETRSWRLHHRGWLLVHAARKFERDVGPELTAILDGQFGPGWAARLPVGALIGLVHIEACATTVSVYPRRAVELVPEPEPVADFWCGDFRPGRFAFRRSEFRVFDRPVPWRGQQGVFEVPDAVVPAPGVQGTAGGHP